MEATIMPRPAQQAPKGRLLKPSEVLKENLLPIKRSKLYDMMLKREIDYVEIGDQKFIPEEAIEKLKAQGFRPAVDVESEIDELLRPRGRRIARGA
jgi:hypothetical protein